MNSFVKSSLIFLGGFATGIGTAYIVATQFFDFEYVDENSKSEKSPDGNLEKPIETYSDPDKNEDILEDTPADAFKESYQAIESNDHYIDYTKLLKQITYNTDSESDDIYDNIIPDNVDIFGDPLDSPVLIKDIEYGRELEYDEITIRYYEKQDLLTDDWDEPIENIEDTVGHDALEKLRKGDSDAVYVRNDRLKVYYEIVCHIEDYPGISG